MDAVLAQELADLRGQVAMLREEVTALRAPALSLLSLEEAARELKMRPATLRAWKRSGKLKPVDVGGKYPKFRRADIERIAAEGIAVLTKIARRPRAPRAPAMPVEVEPLESMLARAKEYARQARERARADRAVRSCASAQD